MNELVAAPRPRRVARLMVVGDTAEVPPWVRHWCRRTGRELRTHPTRLERVHPHEIVADDGSPGLLVVGGPCPEAPYGPHRFGPVTSSALHHATGSVLLVPRRPDAGALVA